MMISALNKWVEYLIQTKDLYLILTNYFICTSFREGAQTYWRLK